MLASLANGVLLSVVGPTVPAIAARLHVRESDMGVVFGANFLIAAFCTPVAGRLYDLVGPRVMFPLGLTCMALGALGEGLAPSLPLLALAAIVGGLGIGINTVTNNVTPSALYPERSESVLNLLNALFGTGAFLAPLAASFSLMHLGGYAPAYIATAALLAHPGDLTLRGLAGGPAGGRGAHHAPTRAAGGARTVGVWRHQLPLSRRRDRLWGLDRGHRPPDGARQHRCGSAHRGVVLAVPGARRRADSVPAAPRRRARAPHRARRRRGRACRGGAGARRRHGPAGGGDRRAIGLAFAPIFPLTIAGAVRVVAVRAPGAIGGATALVLMAGQFGAATVPPLQGMLLRGGTLPAIAVTCVCSLAMLVIQRAISRAQST